MELFFNNDNCAVESDDTVRTEVQLRFFWSLNSKQISQFVMESGLRKTEKSQRPRRIATTTVSFYSVYRQTAYITIFPDPFRISRSPTAELKPGRSRRLCCVENSASPGILEILYDNQ
jgi:hypothetical protein